MFVQAPDKSLFVKSILPNSSAWQSGVEIGDCLMKASGIINIILKFEPRHSNLLEVRIFQHSHACETLYF